MGALINAIINFLKSLFGGGDSAPAASLPTGGGGVASASSVASSSSSSDDDDDDGDDDYAEENFKELQQLIARVESGAVNLNGIDWQDPKGIWIHQFAIEEAQGQGQTSDQGAQAQGYTDQDHFQTVLAYVQAKWSRLGVNDDGEKDVITDDKFMNAAMEARMGQMAGMQAAAAAADPTLLQPVNGITVEAWAAASAEMSGLGANASQAQVAEMLAKHGMDLAAYNGANTGWQAKMQGDTTGVIATKFGEAFTSAKGVSAGGAEPVSFEKFVEVMAAQEAWAEQGMDVNAQLNAVFSIDAGTYGAWGGYWSPKMATDMALMRQYDQFRDKYLAKYKGAGMDDDLSL